MKENSERGRYVSQGVCSSTRICAGMSQSTRLKKGRKVPLQSTLQGDMQRRTSSVRRGTNTDRSHVLHSGHPASCASAVIPRGTLDRAHLEDKRKQRRQMMHLRNIQRPMIMRKRTIPQHAINRHEHEGDILGPGVVIVAFPERDVVRATLNGKWVAGACFARNGRR